MAMGNKTGGRDWKPGESGNPKGRPPKEESLTELLRLQGELEDVKDGDKKISRREAAATKLWSLALSGDVACLKYLFDRLDGRPDVSHQVDMAISGHEKFLAVLEEAARIEETLQLEEDDDYGSSSS